MTCQKRDAPLSPERVLLRKNLLFDLVTGPEDLVDLPHLFEALDTGFDRKDIVLLPRFHEQRTGRD